MQHINVSVSCTFQLASYCILSEYQLSQAKTVTRPKWEIQNLVFPDHPLQLGDLKHLFWDNKDLICQLIHRKLWSSTKNVNYCFSVWIFSQFRRCMKFITTVVCSMYCKPQWNNYTLSLQHTCHVGMHNNDLFQFSVSSSTIFIPQQSDLKCNLSFRTCVFFKTTRNNKQLFLTGPTE